LEVTINHWINNYDFEQKLVNILND